MSNSFMNKFNAARTANTRVSPPRPAWTAPEPIAAAPSTPVAATPTPPVAATGGAGVINRLFGGQSSEQPTAPAGNSGGFGGGFSGLFTSRTPPARTPVDPNRYIEQRNQVRAAAALARSRALGGE
jgi:hypothetical protein